MNCDDVQRLLNDAEAASRGARGSRGDALERHLEACAACRSEWQVQALVAGVPIAPPSADLASLAQRALPGAVAESHRRRSAWPRPVIVGGILLAGAGAAAALMNLSLRPAGDPGTLTDASPVIDAPATARGVDFDGAATAGDVPEIAGAETGAGSSDAADGAADDDRAPGISLDRSWIAVLPIPVDAASAAVLDVANQRREMLMQRVAATEGLRLVDPSLVQIYFDGGMSDLEIGRAIGAGVVIVPEIETRQFATRISFSKLDPVDEFMLAGPEYIYRDDEAELAAADAERFGRANELVWDNNLSVLIDYLLHEAQPELAPSTEELLAQNRAVLLDVSRSDAERVDALEALRGMQRPDSIYIGAAISLLEDSADPDVRRRAVSSMERVDDPILVPPLLRALDYDSSEAVRIAAAEALGTFADEPSVLEALARTEAEDDAAAVRDAAVWSALSLADRLAARRADFLDPDLPAIERVHELNFGIGSSAIDPPLPVDDAVARELLDLSLNHSDAAVRTLAMTELYYLGVRFPDFRLDPSLGDSLIATLRENPDSRLRITAIYALRLMPGTPEISAALETARDSDADRLVRNRAREALERGR